MLILVAGVRARGAAQDALTVAASRLALDVSKTMSRVKTEDHVESEDQTL